LTSLRHDLSQKAAEVKMIHVERDEQVKHIAQLDRLVENLEGEQDEATQSHDRLVQDLQAVETEIASKEKKLLELLPKLSSIKEKETKAKQRYYTF
jgi:chromosome segregation ATPase